MLLSKSRLRTPARWAVFAITCAAVLGSVLSLMGSGGCSEDPEEIRIGVIYPLTGKSGAAGNECKEGVELAAHR